MWLIIGLLMQNSLDALANVWPSTQVAPGTSIEAGVLVFKLKPEIKSLARLHTIEHRALQQALAAVGARALTQTFPRAILPAKGQEAQGVDLALIYRISYPATVTFEQAQQQLMATGAVTYVTRLYRREIMFQPNDPLADSTRTNANQYHLKNIRAYRAWDVEQGDTTVVIGLVDTGTLFSHQDLQGQFALNYADPINGIDDDNDGYIDNFRGWDVADNDNNPAVDATNVGNSQPTHGALVSGTLAASTNNGKGVAGAAYRCRFMPIKVFQTTYAGHFAGYEGIVYAADHGCKVINCSWGGAGYSSPYEQDIITYATVNRNAVVVAAAGNTSGEYEFYPASYIGAISVASLDRYGVKGLTNTYSRRVTVGAPGKQIYTTHSFNDSSYASVSGSSFASPLVAATAALVRHRFPWLTAAQVVERVRVTADASIYALPGNANFQEKLGSGQVDMYRAVADTTVCSVRAISTRFDQTRNAFAGDTLLLEADFINYLAPLQDLTVSLSSQSPYVQVLSNTFSAGPLSTQATTTNVAQPFRVVLLPNTPAYSTVSLRYAFHSTNGYTDYQYVTIEVNPAYLNLAVNRVLTSVTSQATLGFDHNRTIRGDGLRFNGSTSLLSEGGLLVGSSATHVSDMLRSDLVGLYDQDFQVLEPIRYFAMPGTDQAATSLIEDAGTARQANVRVQQRAWAHRTPGYENLAFFSYDIINQAPDTLTTGYAGLFADWTILDPLHNATGWDSTRRLGYAYLTTHDTLYAGIKVLTAGPADSYAVDNNDRGAPVQAYDGLTSGEKYAMLASGSTVPKIIGNDAYGTDVSQVVSARLPRLAPSDTAHVAFVLVMAHDLAGLQAAADSAQALYNEMQLPVALPQVTNSAQCGPGRVALTASGATTGGSYRWYDQPSDGTLLQESTSGVFLTPLLTTTTTYYVSAVTRTGRESDRVAAVAPIDALPTATLTASGATTFCAGESVELVATGGASYRWSTGATTPTLTVSQSGVYFVTAINTAGCEAASAPITVLVNPLATASFAYAANTFCLSGTDPLPVQLDTPGGVFTATPAGLALDAATGQILLSGSAAGTYQLTYSVGTTCVASFSQSLTLTAAPPTPTVTQQPQAGGLLLTSSSATGNQWLFNGTPLPGETAPTLYLADPNAATGNYAVQVSTGPCERTSAAIAVTATVTGTADALASTHFLVYPNPTPDGHLTLELAGYHQPIAIEVMEAAGRTVYRTTLSATGAHQLDLTQLARGVYTLRARTETGLVVRRLVRE
jgi:serine protease